MPTIQVEVAAIRDAIAFTPDGGWWGDGDYPLYWTDATNTASALLRFTGINISQGSTITSAQIMAHSSNTAIAGGAEDYMTWAAEAVDNASQASDSWNAATRSSNLTSSTVQWGITNDGIDQPQPSPELASVVQEIVDRSGWSSGNAIQLFGSQDGVVTNDGRQFHSYATGTAGSTRPVLTITYTEPQEEDEPSDGGGGSASPIATFKVFQNGSWSTHVARMRGVDWFTQPAGIADAPALGSTFHIQYTGTMDWSRNVDVYNVDAFDTTASQVAALRDRGVYPIAYMSLGTAEDWRPDYADFTASDLGNEMADWEGEFFVNPASANVREIMASRLDMIAAKGFLGVDPDNVDGYYFTTGHTANSISDYREYLIWFAGECAERGLACGLKNGQDMIDTTLVNATSFHVVEECSQYDECGASSPFIDAGKPVFNIEYAETVGTDRSFFSTLEAMGHRVAVKNYSLDAWSDDSWGTSGGGSTTLLGVGSDSDSLTTFPKYGDITSGDVYVDSSVSASGDGTSLATAYKTLNEGLAALSSGDTLLVKGDGVTYSLPSEISRNTNWASETIIAGYGTDRPILDAAGITPNDSALKFSSNANNETWHRFHIKNVPDRGSGNYDGQAVVGSRCSNITLSDVWISHSYQTAVMFYEATNSDARDCRAWRLGDGSSTHTNVPDGFQATAGGSSSASQGINFVRCYVRNGADDGYDFFRAENSNVIDSVAHDCGRYWNGNTGGDGQGIKAGGETGTNTVRGSLAIDNRVNGIDTNTGEDQTVLNSTSVDNGAYGFWLDGETPAQTNTATNNIEHNNPSSVFLDTYVTDTYNTWNLSITNPNFADPANHDYSLAGGSAAIGAASDGGNLGASTIALEIAKEWAAKDLS